jgi:hypothetical protein
VAPLRIQTLKSNICNFSVRLSSPDYKCEFSQKHSRVLRKYLNHNRMKCGQFDDGRFIGECLKQGIPGLGTSMCQQMARPKSLSTAILEAVARGR